MERDNDVQLPEWVKPGTSHLMDRNPGDPGQFNKDGTRNVADKIGDGLREIMSLATDEHVDAPLKDDVQAAQIDENKRRAGLQGDQQFYDVRQEIAPHALTEKGHAEEQIGVSARGRRRGNTSDMMGQTVPITQQTAPTAATRAPGAARRLGVESGPMGTLNPDEVSNLMMAAVAEGGQPPLQAQPAGSTPNAAAALSGPAANLAPPPVLTSGSGARAPGRLDLARNATPPRPGGSSVNMLSDSSAPLPVALQQQQQHQQQQRAPLESPRMGAVSSQATAASLLMSKYQQKVAAARAAGGRPGAGRVGASQAGQGSMNL